jgi:hypothetical protein
MAYHQSLRRYGSAHSRLLSAVEVMVVGCEGFLDDRKSMALAMCDLVLVCQLDCDSSR